MTDDSTETNESQVEDETKVESQDETENVEEQESKGSEEIPVRSGASNRAFAAQRVALKEKDQRIQELEKQVEEREETGEPTTLSRRIEALEQAISTSSDESELRDLLSDDPDAKEYEDKIRTYMKHESYQGVPPKVIYHHLAYEKAKRKGAKERAVADLEAEQMGGAGSSSRPREGSARGFPTSEELDNMSEEEFEKLQQKALRGDFLSPDDPRNR